MKRPWTALAPCPIAKELVLIHPRKVYYYLTTFPRQPIPESSDDLVLGVDGKHITPSVSSLDEDEQAAIRERSPSPEVDLSSLDFEEHEDNLEGPAGRGTSIDQFSDPSSHSRLMHSNRAASPPLEGDEKEFTQTASAVRERASEEKAQSERAISVLSESLRGMDEDMSNTDSPMNGGSMPPASPMNEEEYSDYFSHINPAEHSQDLDEAAVATLFGTSPSPSLTSVASSVSSGTSVIDAGVDDEERTVALPAVPQISLPADPDAAPVSTLKRSLDMLNSGLPNVVDLKMSDLTESHEKLSLGPRAFSTLNHEPIFDSWRELQDPESVEVDELDEMFGEI